MTKLLLCKAIQISSQLQGKDLMDISIPRFHNSYFMLELLGKVLNYDAEMTHDEKMDQPMGERTDTEIHLKFLADSSKEIEKLILSLSARHTLFSSHLWIMLSQLDKLLNAMENGRINK